MKHMRSWIILSGLLMASLSIAAETAPATGGVTTSTTTTTSSATVPSTAAAETGTASEMTPAVKKNLYLVTMDSVAISPMTTAQQMVPVVEKMVIPGFQHLSNLQRQGKVLAGGSIAGSKGAVFIVEAVSNEEVSQMIMTSPLWSLGMFKIAPLEHFDERVKTETQVLSQLQSAASAATVSPSPTPKPSTSPGR